MDLNNKIFISSGDFWSRPDFLDLVKTEAKLIKQHFTSKEINKLDTDIVDGDSETSCIYGLMVGTCNSARVNDFIVDNLDVLIRSKNFKDPEFNEFIPKDRTFLYYMTPLEEYITPKDSDNDPDNLDKWYSDAYYDRVEQVINWIKE